MNNNEYEQQKRRILQRYRAMKYRIVHSDPEKDGFSYPLDLNEALRQQHKDRNKELAKLYRKFRGLDPDPFDKEFQQYERELANLDGDTDLYYRKHGWKNGNPNKKSEYVDYVDGKLVHSKRNEKKKKEEQKDDWLKVER